MERGGCKWTPHPWIWQTDGVARGLSHLLYPGCIMIQAHEFYLQFSTWPCITAFLVLWGMWNAAVKAFSLVTRSAHACAVESMHTGDRSKTEAPTINTCWLTTHENILFSLTLSLHWTHPFSLGCDPEFKKTFQQHRQQTHWRQDSVSSAWVVTMPGSNYKAPRRQRNFPRYPRPIVAKWGLEASG